MNKYINIKNPPTEQKGNNGLIFERPTQSAFQNDDV
jgi:hypothetical protein